jgi:hypothetical protein
MLKRRPILCAPQPELLRNKGPEPPLVTGLGRLPVESVQGEVLAAALAAGLRPLRRSYVHHSELVFIAKVIEAY